MATFRAFAAAMDRLSDNVRRNSPRALRRTALAIDQAVVTATPVGNPALWKSKAPPGYIGGAARSNWLVGIGAARNETIPTLGPAALAASIAAATSAINAAPDRTSTIHITNNLPYIEPLNEGWSTQAAAGYVERAIAAAQSAVAQERILGT